MQLIIVGYNLLAQISVAKLHKLWESTKGIGKKKRKYYEKHRRPRRTTSGVWGATCVSPLIAIQEQEAQWRQPSQTQPRGERVLRLAGTANSYSKKKPCELHHIGVLSN